MGADPTASGDGAANALAAYESLAPFYDRFTCDYAHDRWLIEIEAWARAEGLRGRRLLDVACGTGKSFEPLLKLGYRVTACDLSPQMVALARRRAREPGRVVPVDMRALPWQSEFDLVTCINDAVNYLLTTVDLARALVGMARALRPGGIAIFDVNTLRTFRTAFAQEFNREFNDCRFRWAGSSTERFHAGDIARASLTVTAGGRSRGGQHVQRHWRISHLRDACFAAGFDRVEFRGQVPGGRLAGSPDEEAHTKVVCLAVRPRRKRRLILPRRQQTLTTRARPGTHGTPARC